MGMFGGASAKGHKIYSSVAYINKLYRKLKRSSVKKDARKPVTTRTISKRQQRQQQQQQQQHHPKQQQ